MLCNDDEDAAGDTDEDDDNGVDDDNDDIWVVLAFSLQAIWLRWPGLIGG